MTTHLITIDGTDYTGWANRRKYKATHENEGFSWTDINLVAHQIYQRQRVSASLTLTFFDAEAFFSFRDVVMSGTYHTVYLWVDTLGEEVEIEALITYTVETFWTTPAFDEMPGIRVVTMEIKQR